MEKVQAVLDISFASIIRFFIILFFAILLFFSSTILMWIFLALIIAVLLNPFVDFLQFKKIPRIIGTGIVYLVLIIVMAGIIVLIIPTIMGEAQIIIERVPEIKGALSEIKVGDVTLLGIFLNKLEELKQGDTIKMIFDIFSTFFKGTYALIVILSLSFFLCVEKIKIKNFINFIFPKKKETIQYTLDIAHRKIHLWFLIRIINSLFMALVIYFVLFFFGIYSPLILAILIGILSFIPLLGAILISILLLAYISILHTIYLAIIIFIIYLIVNLIADNILTPALSKKILDVSPSLVIIAVVVGAHFYGILGALLAIPAFAIILEFVKTYIKENRTEKVDNKKERVIITT